MVLSREMPKLRADGLVIGFELILPEFAVVVGDLSNDVCRVATDDDVAGDVFDYDRTGGDDHVVSDRYARIDNHAASHPDVVADGDGLGIFKIKTAHVCIDRMTCGEMLTWGPKNTLSPKVT